MAKTFSFKLCFSQVVAKSVSDCLQCFFFNVDAFYISVAAVMQSDSLALLNKTITSLVVKWNHTENQPDEDLYRYYSYYVEYKEKGLAYWIREPIVSYNPDVDPPQATIDGLTSNTEYQVRILGVRTKGTQTDEEDADKTNVETFTTLYGMLFFFANCVIAFNIILL